MRLRAVLGSRCPRCLQGAVFEGRVRMAPECPTCGLVFEREPGYFLGAMYFSYGLALIAAAPLALGLWAAGFGLPAVTTACGVELLVLAPWLFRWSRVGWLHFDQHFDPR